VLLINLRGGCSGLLCSPSCCSSSLTDAWSDLPILLSQTRLSLIAWVAQCELRTSAKAQTRGADSVTDLILPRWLWMSAPCVPRQADTVHITIINNSFSAARGRSIHPAAPRSSTPSDAAWRLRAWHPAAPTMCLKGNTAVPYRLLYRLVRQGQPYQAAWRVSTHLPAASPGRELHLVQLGQVCTPQCAAQTPSCQPLCACNSGRALDTFAAPRARGAPRQQSHFGAAQPPPRPCAPPFRLHLLWPPHRRLRPGARPRDSAPGDVGEAGAAAGAADGV
jgi:hypothetical protein